MITSRSVAIVSLVGCLAIAALAPQAHAAGWSKASRNNAPAPAQAQTQEFVDARMHETLASIDRSLTTLVQVTRGGEPARKPGIIGPTAAGAAGPHRPVARPVGPPTPPMDSSVLSRRVQIQWNGSAQELLQSMSSQLGFSFSSPSHISQKVRLEGQNMTVEQTLNLIAKQLEGKADIVVSLANRKITLVKK